MRAYCVSEGDSLPPEKLTPLTITNPLREAKNLMRIVTRRQLADLEIEPVDGGTG